MTVLVSPFGPKPQFTLSTGLPAVGYQLFFYAAGSSTKQNTYTDSTGGSANTNPVVLNTLGEPSTQIWFTQGQRYKAVLAPSTDTDPPTSPVWTIDNLSGINDTTVSQDEWVSSGLTPTYVSATQFTLAGDQTANFHVGRRVKSTVTAGTSYGTITASAFGALTTITVDTTGSNPLDNGMSAVSYGLLRADNFTQSAGMDVVARQGSDIASAATLNLDAAGGDLLDVTGSVTITAITLARGKTRTLRFTGAPTITNGASLVCPGATNIFTAAGDIAVVRGYAAGVVRVVSYSRLNGQPPIGTSLPRMYISGLTYSNSAGDVTNDIDIAAGVSVDSTGVDVMTLSSTLTKQLDAAWAVGTNAGGLDTGAIGNSDYYIWEIKRVDTGVVDALFSLSSTAPTMPTNYTLKRLIGWFKRVGATIVAFHTYESEGGGIEMNWDTPTLDVNLANTLTTARRTDAVKVPLNFSVVANLSVEIFDGTTGWAAIVQCPDQTDVAVANNNANVANITMISNQRQNAQMQIRTSAAGLIAARSTLATIDEYQISTFGFRWARRN